MIFQNLRAIIYFANLNRSKINHHDKSVCVIFKFAHKRLLYMSSRKKSDQFSYLIVKRVTINHCPYVRMNSFE
jgi:hypothetical protein